MTDANRIEALLAYWCGELDAHGMCSAEHQKLWFNPPEGTDRYIRESFGDLVEQALAGELDGWAETPKGLMALVILLDQFTRNVYRGTPAAFSGDARALSLSRLAVAQGMDADMPTVHRIFLYMPFEHAENLTAQDEGLACFARLMEEAPASQRERIGSFQRYAVAHREVIAEFGRFPHRNHLLGRESTAEELAHLDKHGGF